MSTFTCGECYLPVEPEEAIWAYPKGEDDTLAGTVMTIGEQVEPLHPHHYAPHAWKLRHQVGSPTS